MKLVDMKLPKKTKKELELDMPIASGEERDRWPYGLQIRFESEQIKVLPSLKSHKVGDSVVLYAEGTVTSVRISERQNGSNDHSIEIQLEKTDVQPKVKKAIKDMTPQEYKEMRSSK